MKIIALPDLHITNKKPKHRLDEDFYDTVLNKIKFIQNYAEDNHISTVIQPGDFFDHHAVPKKVISDIIHNIHPFKNDFCKVIWYAVYGQHDLVNHSPNVENTPLNILSSSKTIHTLSKEPITLGNIHLYGASWNEETPEIQDEKAINILAMHRMVIKDEKIWESQEDHTKSQHFLRHSNFNLVISGDNHNSFTDVYRSRLLINCGTLIRNSKNQEDHEPHFYVYDTETKKANKIDIPIESFSKIMDLDTVEKEENFKRKKSKLIEKLKDKNIVGLDFRKKAIKMSYSSKLKQETQKFVFKAIGANEDEIKQYGKTKKRLIKRKRGNTRSKQQTS